MADRVTVIGWDGSPLSTAGRAALDGATLVAAGQYLLQQLPVPPHAERIALGNTEITARRIAEHRGAAVVVAEGDPGFFGVVRTLRRPEYGLELEVLPAVSSVAAAFARVGMPWDDARVVSAHGRGLRRCVNVCRSHSKVAVLTAPGAGPTELALMLRDVHRTFVVCEALGTSDEEVTVLTSDRVADHLWREPNVVLVIGGGGAGGQTGGTAGSGWLAGRPLDFPSAERGWAGSGVPEGGPEGLSAEARAVALARLGPRLGDLVWDVGPADESLAVDLGRFGAAVVAVDEDSEACARLTAEIRRGGVEAEVVGGQLPGVLGELPEPDVVLLRGDARALPACLGRRPERVVVVPRTVPEVEAARRAFGEVGYRMGGVLLQSSGLVQGDAPGRAGSLLTGSQPAFLLWGERP
jgi:precorrin-6Y C5,15-methyltransferase (decarboxylating)